MNTCPSVKNAHPGMELRSSKRPGARTSSPQHSACTHASACPFSISTSIAPSCLPHTAWTTSSSALQGSRCFWRSMAPAHAFNRVPFMNTCHSVRHAHSGLKLSFPSPKGAADFSPGLAEPQRGNPGSGPNLWKANPAQLLHTASASSVCHAIPPQRLASFTIAGAAVGEINKCPPQAGRAVLSPPPSKPKTFKQESACQTEMSFARRHGEGKATPIVFSCSPSPKGASDHSEGLPSLPWKSAGSSESKPSAPFTRRPLQQRLHVPPL